MFIRDLNVTLVIEENVHQEQISKDNSRRYF